MEVCGLGNVGKYTLYVSSFSNVEDVRWIENLWTPCQATDH